MKIKNEMDVEDLTLRFACLCKFVESQRQKEIQHIANQLLYCKKLKRLSLNIYKYMGNVNKIKDDIWNKISHKLYKLENFEIHNS
jgi:hypothetical protein